MKLLLILLLCGHCLAAEEAAVRRTSVSIVGDAFHINGQPTYAGREWRGHRIEGLLMNSRMVQGIFDDRNPATAARWAYPDTGKWDAERNTLEFVAAMPEWRKHGLLAFTINLQGGSPEGYSKSQPWENSAFEPEGSLRPDHMARLARILDRADELGMVAIVGYFYFDFEKPENNFTAAVGERASWGYFDFRMKGEGHDDGYQSVPVNWGLSSPRKRGFFNLLAEITGAAPPR